MAKINIAFGATSLLLLLLLFTSKPAVADQANQPAAPAPTPAAPAPAPAQYNDKQSCLDLLVVKDNYNHDCRTEVLNDIGSIVIKKCDGFCVPTRACCYAVVALDTYHPQCWKYLMNKKASEYQRYILVMTCAKSLPMRL